MIRKKNIISMERADKCEENLSSSSESDYSKDLTGKYQENQNPHTN